MGRRAIPATFLVPFPITECVCVCRWIRKKKRMSIHQVYQTVYYLVRTTLPGPGMPFRLPREHTKNSNK
uniref:Putative secreted protein n=1 Tax=Anopheles darlingi TaxID=43151 RepID=A0A2M4DPM5_ANODA